MIGIGCVEILDSVLKVRFWGEKESSEKVKDGIYRCQGGLVSFFFFFGASGSAASSVLNHLLFQHTVAGPMHCKWKGKGGSHKVE